MQIAINIQLIIYFFSIVIREISLYRDGIYVRKGLGKTMTKKDYFQKGFIIKYSDVEAISMTTNVKSVRD